MSDLTGFLLARIDADEEHVHRNHYWTCPAAQSKEGRCECGQQRPLAECEAKRRITEAHEPQEPERVWCGACSETEGSPCATLRFLALPYSDHPNYRDGWRP